MINALEPVINVGLVTSIGALVGRNALEPYMAGIKSDLMMVLVMYDREVESLFDRLRWMASRSPRWFWIDMLYEISHSCLEYGTRVNG